MAPVRLDPEMRVSLATLRDVAGITGSFVFTDSGQLVARELPALFEDSALAEASGRLTRLREAFAAVGDALDVAVVRFRDHKLYLKTLGAGMLCILADGVVNMPALRMAANLVGRRIAPALERARQQPPEVVATEVTPPPVPERRPPELPPGMRRFRGRPVG